MGESRSDKIKLLSNPNGKKCSKAYELDSRLETINKTENTLIYIRSIDDTAQWNAGIWFSAGEAENIIKELLDKDKTEWCSEDREYIICPNCSKTIKKGENIISICRDCNLLRQSESIEITEAGHKKYRYIVDDVLNRVFIHEGCLEDVIESINNLKEKAVIERI